MRLLPAFTATLLLLTARDGFAQAVSTLANLPSVTGAPATIVITDAGKEGLFYQVASTTPNEAGTVITAGTGPEVRKYKRMISGPINAGWWLNASSTDNATALETALAYAQPMQEVIVPAGNYKFLRAIAIPEDKKTNLSVQGTLEFPNSNGLIVRGSGHKIYVSRIVGDANGDYQSTTGAGLILEDAAQVNVQVGTIVGFAEGIKLTATGTNGSAKRGTQYNRVTFDQLWHNNVGISLTTGAVDEAYRPTGSAPWVNENTITGGAIYAQTGLLMTKGSTQTDPFNNNKFYNVGFEVLETSAMRLNFASANLLIGPRFESHAPIEIAPNCFGNVFLTAEVYVDRLTQLGKNTLLLGRNLNTGGSLYSPLAGSNVPKDAATPLVLKPLVPNP
jgi:hypothetical protein